MSEKSLDTLVEDVHALFDPDKDHEVSEQHLEEFAENLKELIRYRLRKQETSRSPLRFSALGKKDRQLWYEAHPIEGGKEPMLPKTYLKFMYGDVIEQLYLLLVKEAGHSVEQEQGEVDVGGVKGHIDAIINGTVVDVKSASPYGYKKFANQTVEQDDPFGYVEQLSGYASVLTPGKDAAWLAVDKVTGDMCITPLKKEVIKHYQPEPRIEYLKEMIDGEIPERCYEPVPDGKSGNLKLPTPCSYCAHKHRCHPDLRTFIYSTGPRYLTKVAKQPNVPELVNES